MKLDSLEHTVEQLEIQYKWLDATYQKTANINLNGELSVEDFDSLELLSIRFVRSVDFLTRRFLRVLDKTENKEHKGILELIDNAEERELFKKGKIKLLRDMRNKIAYEVIHNDLVFVFPDLLKYVATLKNGLIKSIEYSKELINTEVVNENVTKLETV
jgi:hypothetical protein